MPGNGRAGHYKGGDEQLCCPILQEQAPKEACMEKVRGLGQSLGKNVGCNQPRKH